MQVTLDAFALKSFAKALTCLSRYGDELVVYATTDSFSLSATNSSKSAYCRFKYERQFFSKYCLSARTPLVNEFGDMMSVTGQLLTKSLLSILKHRTFEKTVERCEMSIVEGHQPADDDQPQEDEDGLESRLIVRLHCKHGVIKTHRLILLIPTSLMAPGIPDASNESNLTIGPKAVKDMIEHFPLAKGLKSDPQLIWTFGQSDVELRSLESSTNTQGKAQLATELTISSEEFDVYNIFATPTTIAFHLREFNATIAYADSMTLPLDLRFTDPAAPLFIDVEGDNTETLFVISTSQVHGAIAGVPSQQNQTNSSESRKRIREETPAEPRSKKPMKAVKQVDRRVLPVSPASGPDLDRRSIPPPQASVQPYQKEPIPPLFLPSPSFASPQIGGKAPLFLPFSSQLSIVHDGLGIEHMEPDELKNLLEEEGEEVVFNLTPQDPNYHKLLKGPGHLVTDNTDNFEQTDEGAEIPPTQSSEELKTFQALFED